MGNSNKKKWDIYEKSGRIASAWIGKILKFQFIVLKTFPQGKVLSGDANRTIKPLFRLVGYKVVMFMICTLASAEKVVFSSPGVMVMPCWL